MEDRGEVRIRKWGMNVRKCGDQETDREIRKSGIRRQEIEKFRELENRVSEVRKLRN